jgi:ribosomal protein L11 methyltransferase
MTIKATFTAAFPEARRIWEFLERDYAGEGTATSFAERADGQWSVDAYFGGNDGAEEVAGMLRDWLGADAFTAPLDVEVLPDTDWVASNRESIRPIAAGRFILHGSHHRGLIPPSRFAIEIDAGRAFGTGHHATTAGCLAVLDRLLRTRTFRNPLDLGAGSGVLAIALAKLLRRPVLATDIDATTVEIARENARLNGVGGLVHCVNAAGVDHAAIRRGAPYDLVVANILAEPLMRLAPRVAPLISKGGTLVLSGLLLHQRERVVAAYRGQGLRLIEARSFEGWAVLVFRNDRS